MSLKIAVIKETAANEKRVAVSPDSAKKYVSMGCHVTVQAGAGLAASFTDDMYKDVGAHIAKTDADTLKGADIFLYVQKPDASVLKSLKKGALAIGMFAPYQDTDAIKTWAKTGVTALAMELVPRISRAQAMDVLSSQANLAGYKAVLDATEHFNRAFPMMMTAAGTIPPAKALVMGAGVAGLQAIATAKRLGAVVSATDVRPAAKEQVQSLGANFVAVEDDEFKEAETAGGYAKQMSATYMKKQQALIEETITKQDIVITTALIPGRPAPELITEKMVKSMKEGAVIVDLAVEQGGNCALSEAGKIVKKHGVTIVGNLNIPSRIAASAATLYAKNLQNLLGLLIDSENGTLAIDWDDEIVKGITLTRDGNIVHEQFAKADEKTATKATTKTAAKSAPKKKSAATKTTPKKSTTKSTAKKSTAKKSATTKKKSTTKKTAAKKTAAKKTTAAKKK